MSTAEELAGLVALVDGVIAQVQAADSTDELQAELDGVNGFLDSREAQITVVIEAAENMALGATELRQLIIDTLGKQE